jgi:hypothetical protein
LTSDEIIAHGIGDEVEDIYMPKIVDGTIWYIMGTGRVDIETVNRALVGITEESPEPSPDDLESYYRYWDQVSAKLANQFC